ALPDRDAVILLQFTVTRFQVADTGTASRVMLLRTTPDTQGDQQQYDGKSLLGITHVGGLLWLQAARQPRVCETIGDALGAGGNQPARDRSRLPCFAGRHQPTNFLSAAPSPRLYPTPPTFSRRKPFHTIRYVCPRACAWGWDDSELHIDSHA